jgi:DNA-binding protein HU-beta
MNKQDIITKMAELVVDGTGTKVQAEKYLTAFLDTLEYAVKNKNNFKLVGYFGMEIVERAGKTGRNPQTGEVIQILKKNVIKTTIGKNLKQLAL